MRVRAALIVVAIASLAPLAAQGRLSRQEADRFQSKLTRIVEYGNIPGKRTSPPRSTPMTDVEVNSYLKFHAGDQIPDGIVDPTLNAVGGGRVSGRAIVDLDAVRKQQQRGWLDPMGT